MWEEKKNVCFGDLLFFESNIGHVAKVAGRHLGREGERVFWGFVSLHSILDEWQKWGLRHLGRERDHVFWGFVFLNETLDMWQKWGGDI